MAKAVLMRKSGHRDCEVNPKAVENFEANGWTRADGSKAEQAPVEDSGLSDAEKKKEIEAAGSVARKQGAKDGLKGKELEAFVQSAKDAAAEALAE